MNSTDTRVVRLRPWQGLDDLVGMAAANQQLRSHLGLLQPIELDEMRHHYQHLVNCDLATDLRIVELDGVTAGYARVEWHNLQDGDRGFGMTVALEPATWGTGAMDRVLDWAEARCAAIAATLPADRKSWLEDWVFGGDAEHEAALERRGYNLVRWGGEMLRDTLDDIADQPLADGYTLRAPEEHELPAVFDAMNAAFRDEWGEVDAADWRYDEWVGDPRFRRELVVVAWHGSGPASIVMNVLTPGPNGRPRGLLDGVGTVPAHRRRGLARACVTESLRRFKAAGAASAYLGVDQESENRTVALYEACGFRLASESSTWRRRLVLADAEAQAR
jgi:ribosomal protein S18 acetylase RimI-like enzyme